jgi:hypothetical protein
MKFIRFPSDEFYISILLNQKWKVIIKSKFIIYKKERIIYDFSDEAIIQLRKSDFQQNNIVTVQAF